MLLEQNLAQKFELAQILQDFKVENRKKWLLFKIKMKTFEF